LLPVPLLQYFKIKFHIKMAVSEPRGPVDFGSWW